MMRHIRPWQLFSHLNGTRDIQYRIPSEPGRESGTVSALDTLCMIAAIRITGVRTLLELGTGLGYNAYHLCLNTNLERITTIDKEERSKRAWLPDFSHRVTPVVADVMTIGTTFHHEMTFCDINAPGITERCTEIAFSANPLLAAWHDYGHPDVPHVKSYLDPLDLPLIHIEDSLMVFWFKGGLE